MPIDINVKEAVYTAKNPVRWLIPYQHSREEENSIMFNGHTVEISPSLDAYVFYDGKKYKLLQFHFHTPSENRLDGDAFASEVHLVHQADDGSLMVSHTPVLFVSRP
jgi:carbonic anhydrase